ncbi:hypothetical protein ACIRJM_48970, partial [Streptomyces sp. NPDC102405]
AEAVRDDFPPATLPPLHVSPGQATKYCWSTRWRAIATDAGATPVLVYLAASHDELWARVSKRNEAHADDPNSIYFSESDLQRYRTRFIPPEADEPHMTYDGDVATVVAALEAARF